MTSRETVPASERRWPEGGPSRVPYWAYTDPEVYQRELDRVFCGESWAYVGLEIEIPNPGDFKLATVGDRPLIMNRDKAGNVNVLVNRCAHRGVKVCNQPWGNAKSLVCPYHLWSYDLQGRLRGVPFADGVGGRGGMPADFRREDHGMEKLRLSTRGGAVFATFSSTVEAFKDYLGPVMLPLLRPCLRRPRAEVAGLREAAHSRQLEDDVRKHQGSVPRQPDARVSRHVRLVPRRQSVCGPDGRAWPSRGLDLDDLRAHRRSGPDGQLQGEHESARPPADRPGGRISGAGDGGDANALAQT